MKLVSVLICTYNAENTIERTIKSCLNQTYKNIEILIHDDQSKDKTLEIIENLWDDRIKIIDSWKKLWPYKGLNFLLDNAKGEYIAIQDHDDLWHPKKIEKQIEFLEKNKQYVWCWTKTLMRYEWDNKWFDYYLWDENYYTIHPSLVFRNDKKYRYPNATYMCDAIFEKNVLCNWKNLIWNIDETLTIHRIKSWFKNYTYKRYKPNIQSLKTVFYLHPRRYGIWATIFELLRMIVYPTLHKIKKDNLINNFERIPYLLLWFRTKTINNHLIYSGDFWENDFSNLIK